MSIKDILELIPELNSRMKSNIKKFVENKNNNKKLFTPGPASLLYENILPIEPCFGRGDAQYEKIENIVLNKLKKFLVINILRECKEQRVLH